MSIDNAFKYASYKLNDVSPNILLHNRYEDLYVKCDQCNETQKDNDTLQKMYDDIQAKYNVVCKERDIIQKEHDILKDERDMLQVQFDELLAKRQRKEAQNQKKQDAIKEENEDLKKENVALKNRCSSIQFSRDSLKQERATLKQQCNVFKKDLKTVCHTLDNERYALKHMRNVLQINNNSVNVNSKLQDDSSSSSSSNNNNNNNKITTTINYNDLREIRLQSQQAIIDDLKDKYNDALHLLCAGYQLRDNMASINRENMEAINKIDKDAFIDQKQVLKKIIANVANMSKDRFTSYSIPIDDQKECIRIPKIIKILTNGGIIKQDDLDELEVQVSQHVSWDGFIKVQDYSFQQGVVESTILYYRPDTLNKIIDMCVNWICHDKNASRLAYDIIE